MFNVLISKIPQKLFFLPRFSPELNPDSSSLTKTMLCMPIRDTRDVLGVISLINKEGEGFFTENDERFVEAFSLFCGMAIRNASDFERAVVSEAKLQVAFETMNYQASSGEDESRSLVQATIPSASAMNLRSLQFSYLGMDDMETFKVKEERESIQWIKHVCLPGWWYLRQFISPGAMRTL